MSACKMKLEDFNGLRKFSSSISTQSPQQQQKINVKIFKAAKHPHMVNLMYFATLIPLISRHPSNNLTVIANYFINDACRALLIHFSSSLDLNSRFIREKRNFFIYSTISSLNDIFYNLCSRQSISCCVMQKINRNEIDPLIF